jgi:hypothetical protein
MDIRFYFDAETGQPHIFEHGVTEDEVHQVLRNPGEDRAGDEGRRVAIGKTIAGRSEGDLHTRCRRCQPVRGHSLRFDGQASESLPAATARETTMKNNAKRPKARQTNQQKFPPGWNEKRVRKVLAHYENQTEDEAIAEDEAAYNAEGQSVMIVPTELVPAIRELLGRRRA